MSTLGERIRLIRKGVPEKTTQEKFGEALGVTRAAVTAYELDKARPPPATLKLICMKYNVNQAWLETGEGDPYLDSPDEQITMAIAALMQGKPQVQIALMATLAAMPDEWWSLFSNRLAMETERLKDMEEL